MRRQRFQASLVAATALTACSWSRFDDLQNQATAVSEGNPGVKSNDFGLDIVAIPGSGSVSAALAVLGNDDPTISILDYDSHGNITSGSNKNLATDSGITSLPNTPVLVSDLVSGDVALAIPSGQGNAAVYFGVPTGLISQELVGQATPNSAVWVEDPSGSDSILIINATDGAGSNRLNHATINNPSFIGCLAQGSSYDALAVVGSGASTTVYGWGIDGTLEQFGANAFTCAGSGDTVTATPVATIGAPGAASKLIPIPGTTQLIFAQIPDDGSETKVGVIDVSTGAGSDSATGVGAVASIAFGSIISDTGSGSATPAFYAVFGVPTFVTDGVEAGDIELHEVGSDGSGAYSVDAVSTLILQDSQPTSNESFGRTVSLMSFTGSDVSDLIVVGAADQVITYFATTLYDDPRE